MSKLKIPESWAMSKIKNVVSVEYGKGLPERDRKQGSVKVVASGGIVGVHNQHLYDKPIIVTGRKGSIGAAHFITDKSWVIDTAFALLPSEAIIPKYLFWRLRNFDFSSIEASTAIPSISRDALYEVELPIPPLKEQQRIVAKIESTQEKIKTIESNVEQAEALIEKYRESILQKAFRGQLVPQNPNDESASKLLERIRAERDKPADLKKKKKDDLPPIKPEEIPFEIPKSWEWVRLGDIVSVSSGDGLIAADQKKGEIPVFGGNGIAGYHNIANLESETIVIGRVGAKCGVVHITPQRSWVTDNALIVSPKINLDQKWLAEVINWLNLNADANRSAQPVISGIKIYPRMIPLPPLEEQININNAIHKQMQIIEMYLLTLMSIRENSKQVLNAVLNSGFNGTLVPQIPSEGTGHELLHKIHPSTVSSVSLTSSTKSVKKVRSKK